MHLLLLISIGLGLAFCSPQPQTSSRTPNPSKKGEPLEALAANGQSKSPAVPASSDSEPIKKVSAFSLDDQGFDVIRIATGLQTFMESETPVISYKMPKDADYVEILRCQSDVKLVSGIEPMAIVDLEISGLTDARKSQLYRSNDYFKAGEDHAGCELITDGHAGQEFFDSFAPSGSYRYMIRACVSPKRLIDKEKLSGRNCSRRVGVSTELADYTNHRKKKEAQALKLASIYGARIDATATSMKILAESANDILNDCEERNHDRLVNKKVRDAWLTIAGAMLEVAVEFKVTSSFLKADGKKGGAAGILGHYGKFYKKPQSFIDMTQLIGAMQAYMTADIFIKLGSSSHDMVRSCDTYKRLMDEYRLAEASLGNFGYKFQYYFAIAQLAQMGQLAANGDEVELPQLDMRQFQDAELPPPPTTNSEGNGGATEPNGANTSPETPGEEQSDKGAGT